MFHSDVGYEIWTEKQKNVEKVKESESPFNRGVWVGFTFGKNGLGMNAGLPGDEYTMATIF